MRLHVVLPVHANVVHSLSYVRWLCKCRRISLLLKNNIVYLIVLRSFEFAEPERTDFLLDERTVVTYSAYFKLRVRDFRFFLLLQYKNYKSAITGGI